MPKKIAVLPISAPALLAELKTLADKAGENLFRRIQIVRQLFEDKAWLLQVGGYEKAHNYLSDFFPDVGDRWSIGQLVSFIKTFPDIEFWRKYKFELHAIHMEDMSQKMAKAREESLKMRKEYEEGKQKEQYQERKRRSLLSAEERQREDYKRFLKTRKFVVADGVSKLNVWLDRFGGHPDFLEVAAAIRIALAKTKLEALASRIAG